VGCGICLAGHWAACHNRQDAGEPLERKRTMTATTAPVSASRRAMSEKFHLSPCVREGGGAERGPADDPHRTTTRLE
jgi:hypothetical protein